MNIDPFSKLSSQQKAYVRYVVAGMSLMEACQRAYPNTKIKHIDRVLHKLRIPGHGDQ
jgi:hypothetical protein